MSDPPLLEIFLRSLGDLAAKRTASRLGCDPTSQRAGTLAQQQVRSARGLRAVDGKLEKGEQPRLIVLEVQLPVVEVGNRLSQREAEAGPFVRAAGIETREPLHRFLAAAERNPGTPVRDLDPDSLFSRL